MKATELSFIDFSNSDLRKNHKEWILHDRIYVFIKDPLPECIDIEHVIQEIEKNIPSSLTQEIDDIFIGHFQEFYDRDINAFYENGAIYITNDQTDEKDLIEDIVHEIAHSVEELHNFIIYDDEQLEKEFLAKRQRLADILNNSGNAAFYNPDYNKRFDMYLYKDLGYEKLSTLIPGLFMSPYSVTSLREYFANGFENYFLKKNGHNLRKICPVLFNKLEDICDG